MMTNEITHEKFEKTIKNLHPPTRRSRYNRHDVPINYAYYDSYEKYNKIEKPEWDVDKDDVEKEKKIQELPPPPMPEYNRKNCDAIPIEDLLNEPGRKSRPEKMVIFIRGAPSSGKSYLANKIIKHEKKFGTKRMKFCTANKYWGSDFLSKDQAEKLVNNLHSEVIDLLKEGFYTFIIVEVEGGKMDMYNNCVDVAKEAGYEYYGIDVNQKVEVCRKYMKHSRAHSDIEDIAKLILNNSIPYHAKVIDPIEIVDPGWKARQPPPKVKTPSPPPKKRFGKYARFRRNYGSDDDDHNEYFACNG